MRAAPMLFGYRGSVSVDVAALEQLLLRVARLADSLPEVAELELNPVLVAADGISVLTQPFGSRRPAQDSTPVPAECSDDCGRRSLPGCLRLRRVAPGTSALRCRRRQETLQAAWRPAGVNAPGRWATPVRPNGWPGPRAAVNNKRDLGTWTWSAPLSRVRASTSPGCKALRRSPRTVPPESGRPQRCTSTCPMWCRCTCGTPTTHRAGRRLHAPSSSGRPAVPRWRRWHRLESAHRRSRRPIAMSLAALALRRRGQSPVPG